jgi:hypothetical protein
MVIGDPSGNFNSETDAINGVLEFHGGTWWNAFLAYSPHNSSLDIDGFHNGTLELVSYDSGGTAKNVNFWVNGEIEAALDVYSRGSKLTSDARLKTDIQPLRNPLNALDQIHGVRFRWKKDGRRDLGVIAQDVEEVFPELVSEVHGNKAVAYGNLVAVVIEALKQHRSDEATELRRLKSENAALQARLEHLESRIERLSAAPAKRPTLAQAR